MSERLENGLETAAMLFEDIKKCSGKDVTVKEILETIFLWIQRNRQDLILLYSLLRSVDDELILTNTNVDNLIEKLQKKGVV